MLSFPIFLCCVVLGIEHFLFSFLLPHSVSFSSLPPSTSSSLSFSPSPFPSRYALCISPPPHPIFPLASIFHIAPPHPLINFSHIFSFSFLLFLPLILLPPHSLLPAPSSLQLMLVKISADSRSRGTPDSLPLPPSPLLSLSLRHPTHVISQTASALLHSSPVRLLPFSRLQLMSLCVAKKDSKRQRKRRREREREAVKMR